MIPVPDRTFAAVAGKPRVSGDDPPVGADDGIPGW